MIHDIDPIIFSLGPFSIRYYGLIYMSGFIIAYFFLKYAIKTKKISLAKNDLSDYIFYTVIFVVLGARLFEIIFYEPSYYLKNPLKVFAIWEGGLSFHGGLFGVYISTLIFCKKKKIPFLLWGDFLSIPASISLFLGRFANFVNGELYGYPIENQVNPPWYAVKFIRTDPLKLWRIPTQILESFKNLLIFIILFILWKKIKDPKQGMFMWFFILLYGTFRFFIEFYKEAYQNIFLGLSMGHLLCIPMIILGIIGLYFTFRNKRIPANVSN